MEEIKYKIKIDNLSYYYERKQALRQINLNIQEHAITVLFGPSGGGKTTLLRLINRLNDLIEGTRLEGKVWLDGEDIYAPQIHLTELRRRVGMVFALPLPLPGTIRDNVLYASKLAGIHSRMAQAEMLERSLSQAALWDEVKDRLDEPASSLSGGQQQRLCIARSLALQPDVLLPDEPTSDLDPISTAKVEESLQQLKKEITIVIVPHSIQQAARVADYAAFFLMGELIESGRGVDIFTTPQNKKTEDYITGRFG